MDNDIENEIRQHIDREHILWKDLHAKLDKAQQAIDSLRVDLRDAKQEQSQLRALVEPFAEFLTDMRTVGRLGRGLRALVGWIALFLGAGALIYVAVVGEVKQ